MSKALLSAYRWNRCHYVGNVYPRNRDYQRHNPAHEALKNARRDVAEGKKRYPASYGWNPAFAAYGSTAMRWIEKPAACGLRFVGYADKIVDLRHTGWFTDNDQNETVRGVVFQMPGRNGKPLFVPGYDDPNNGSADNGGPVCLDFGDVIEGEGVEFVKSTYGNYWTYESNPAEHDGCRDAARRADRIAELMAESEREHQAAWQAGNRFAELGDEIAQRRAEIVDGIRQFKAARRALETGAELPGNPEGKTLAERFGRLCQIIRGDVGDEIERIREARQERAKLKEGDYISEWLPGFSTRDSSLCTAFNEGAGETIFAC